MQKASSLSGQRSRSVELLAVALAISVAIVAASRADVPPTQDNHAAFVVKHPVMPSPVQDDLAAMIADMKLHD